MLVQVLVTETATEKIIFAFRDQEFQERARPENNHDENQAVDLQVISVFFQMLRDGSIPFLQRLKL